ncbi:probable gluconokinase [Mercenaria mercenaria]|uniref:probable gluconokinase n=1 Tax=Mercenaria mercenaria TaxID=6596 RepID=UPI00234F9A0A|nr:probable gluconokinase [Mercenaria mercenaria]
MIIIVMGVSGCGKTTIGSRLAKKLGWQFADADEFHSEENKIKMSAGQPLTDQDRLPWLQSIHNFVRRLSQNNQSGVVTCSALKKVYRNVLRNGYSPLLHSEIEHVTEKPDMETAKEHNEHQKDSELYNTQEVDIVFIHLTGSRDVLETRLVNRLGHFMPAKLLQSQLDTLENLDKQEKGFNIDIDNTEENITKEIIGKIGV